MVVCHNKETSHRVVETGNADVIRNMQATSRSALYAVRSGVIASDSRLESDPEIDTIREQPNYKKNLLGMQETISDIFLARRKPDVIKGLSPAI